jgi:hypothetical protein
MHLFSKKMNSTKSEIWLEVICCDIILILDHAKKLSQVKERLVIPMANPPIYRKELKLLEAVAQQRANKL